MTDSVDFDIVGSYNNQRVSSIDSERSVNCFEYIDPASKKKKALINTAGLLNGNRTFPGATGGFRAQFVFNTDEYSVIGNGLFKENSIGSISFLGTLTTNTGYVGVDANTFQIEFVDGSDGYIWDTIANTFTVITDTSFPPNPIDVCNLDGFFVVASGGTNTFLLSSLNQGLVYGGSSNVFTANAVTDQLTVTSNTLNYQTGVPFTVTTTGTLPAPLTASTQYFAIRIDATHIKVATSYANAIAGIAINITGAGSGTNTLVSDGQLQQGAITSHPGTIVACRTLHRRLFLFSQYFTEVWENAGIGTNLPFRRNNSLLIEYGTPCIGSIAVGFDKMFFLSQDRDGLGSVMEVIGAQAIPISNRALDFQLAQYAAAQQITDCRAFLIKENGLIFYRMNFTAANHTFVYDVSLSDPTNEDGNKWHEEEVLNGDRHPAQTHAYFNGINYVGDYLSPILYIVSNDVFTNNGEAIRRMRISRPIVPPGYQRIRVDRFQLDMLQGNISDLLPIQQDINLLTEDGDPILTESGDNIILDQSFMLSNPQELFVFLSLSKDGGQTYGYLVKAPMGAPGQRRFRTVWRKLGVVPRGQAFVVKIEFFQAVPFIVLGASWCMEVMPE